MTWHTCPSAQVLSKPDTERFVAAAYLLLAPGGVFFGSTGGAEEAGPLTDTLQPLLSHVESPLHRTCQQNQAPMVASLETDRPTDA